MAAGRTSWRDSKLRKPPATQKRRRKWGVTLILAICVAWFAWVIIPRKQPEPPRTRVVSIVIDRTKSRRVQPLPYPEPRLPATSDRIHVEKKGGTEASSLGALDIRSGDAAADRDPDAALVVFLRAEGVSLNDRPLVLCSDFMESRAPAAGDIPGTIDFNVILEAVSRSNAQLKVIVCDYGRTNMLPELGLFKNEFANLVARDVAARKDARDRSLFVILSHAPQQLSEVQHARRGTVFSNAVYDVLSEPRRWDPSETNAPTGAEAQITFGEFVRTIRGRCDHHCKGDLAQTPIVIRGGEGIVQDLDADLKNRFLVFVPPEPPKEEEGEDAAAKEKKQARTNPPQSRLIPPTFTASILGGLLDRRAAPREEGFLSEPASRIELAQATEKAAAPAVDAKAETAPSTDAAASPPPADPAPAPQLPGSENSTVVPVNTPATPVAPPKAPVPDSNAPPPTPIELALEASRRAWDAYAALAGRADRLQWSPVDFSSNDFREVGRELCELDVQLWMTRNSPGRATARLNTVAGRLESLAQRIDGNAESDSAGQRRAEPLDRLDVDWRRFDLQAVPRRSDLDQEFKKLSEARGVWTRGEDLLFRLVQYVEWYDAASMTLSSRPPHYNKLVDLIAACDALQWTSTWKTAEGVDAAQLNRLNGVLARCETLSAELDLFLEEEGNRLVNELAHANEVDIAFGRSAEVLLSTPLLNREQRRKLLALLIREMPEPKEAIDPPTATVNESWRADRANERARLRARLLALATGRPIEDPVDAGQFSKPYLDALQTVRNEFSSRSAVEMHFLTLVCDVRGEVSPLPDLAIQKPPEPDTLELKLAGAAEVYLDAPTVDRNAGWKSISIDVVREGPSRPPVVVTIGSAIPGNVELVLADHDPDSPRTRTIPADSRFPVTVEARVRATGLVSVWEGAPLEIVATAGLPSQRALVKRVPLHVYRPTANSVQFAFHDAGKTQLQSFQVYPRGTTPVSISLINNTGRPLQMEFDLLRAPEPLSRAETPEWKALCGVLADPATGVLSPTGQSLRLMAATATFEANGADAPISFQPPAMPKPPAAADAAAAAPPAAVAESAPVDISHGLICVAREVGAPAGAEPIVQMIPVPVVPLRPAEYLDATARYDAENGRLIATLRRKNRNELRPIPVRIGNPEDFAGAAMESEALLKDQEASVHVSLPEDGVSRNLSIDVDGYPRAFVFAVECVANQPAKTSDRGWRDIRIRRVGVDKDPWAYEVEAGDLVRAVSNPAVPPAPGAPPPPAPFTGTLAFVPLKAPVEAPLIVELSADVPVSDNAVITLTRTGLPPITFPSDRKRVFHFQLAEKGGFEVQCQLSDWTTQVSLAGLENVETSLTAALQYENNDRTLQAPPLRFRIDRLPPLIAEKDVWISDASGLPRIDRVVKAAQPPAFIWVTATDPLSGVGVRTVEIQVHDAQQAAAGPPLVAKPWNESQGQWRLELSPLLKELPPDRTYQVDVVARDLLGNASEEAFTTFSLVLGTKKEMEAPGAMAAGTVAGKVLLGSSGKSGMKVELVGGNNFSKTATSASGGAFRFTDVPGGTYTLKASGFAQGSKLTGESAGVKPIAPGDDPKSYDVMLK